MENGVSLNLVVVSIKIAETKKSSFKGVKWRSLEVLTREAMYILMNTYNFKNSTKSVVCMCSKGGNIKVAYKGYYFPTATILSRLLNLADSIPFNNRKCTLCSALDDDFHLLFNTC